MDEQKVRESAGSSNPIGASDAKIDSLETQANSYHLKALRETDPVKESFFKSVNDAASLKADHIRMENRLKPEHDQANSIIEEVRNNDPRIDDYSCLVPGSLHLLFDLSISNTKTHFLNNLSKLLQSKLKITLAGKILYENDAESEYRIYKDLYKSKSQRENMIQYGVGSTNLRKLISEDDSGATSGDSTKVSEKLMFDIYGTKQKICLDKIIGNHGLYAPYHMIHNFNYHMKFPKSEEILVAQTGQTRGRL